MKYPKMNNNFVGVFLIMCAFLTGKHLGICNPLAYEDVLHEIHTDDTKFLRQCKQLSTNVEIESFVQKHLQNKEICSNLEVKESAKLLTDFYNVAIFGETPVNISDIVHNNCPKLKNDIECDIDFLNNVPDCFEPTYLMKLISQMNFCVKILDFFCKDDGKIMKIFREYNGFECLAREKVTLLWCINRKIIDNPTTNNSTIDHSPYSLTKFTGSDLAVCNISKNKQCVLSALDRCEADQQVYQIAREFIEIMQLLFMTACPDGFLD